MRPGSALAAVTAVAAGLLAACSPPGPAWRVVDLPDGVRPAALAVEAGGLLVGGQQFGGTQGAEDGRPVLVRLDAAGRVTPVPLAPVQPYARVADLVAVTPTEDELIALGVARGGAHGNERWTVWDGSAQGPVADRQQASTPSAATRVARCSACRVRTGSR